MTEGNALEQAEGAVEDESGLGARAPTTDEARALLEVACSLGDGRSRGRRGDYFACLFLAGCRYCEPGRWRWGHLKLDAEIPHVAWSADIQLKNRRRAMIALAPELADLLRGLPRGKPDEPVFRYVPSSATFRADRDRAGIVPKDDLGRSFSPHGARKWFSTTLTNAGVPPRMVDYLMRHTSSVESRYYQPTLEDQARALQILPALLTVPQGIRKSSCKNDEKPLIQGRELGDIGGAKPMFSTHHNQPTPRPSADMGLAIQSRLGAGSVGFAGQPFDQPGSSRDYQSRNRGYGASSATALRGLARAHAELLAVVEGLIREEQPDGHSGTRR